MEFSWELVEKGHAGVITLVGMGGVFTALIFLYIFTSLLGRIGRRRRSVVTDPQETPQQDPPPAGRADDGESLAAAVAVSLALSGRSRAPQHAGARAAGGEDNNPWRLAGRRALMRPLAPVNRTRR